MSEFWGACFQVGLLILSFLGGGGGGGFFILQFYSIIYIIYKYLARRGNPI